MNSILINLSFHVCYKLNNLTGQILIKNALGNGLYSTALLIFLLMFSKPIESENQQHGVYFSAAASLVQCTNSMALTGTALGDESRARRRGEVIEVVRVQIPGKRLQEIGWLSSQLGSLSEPK